MKAEITKLLKSRDLDYFQRKGTQDDLAEQITELILSLSKEPEKEEEKNFKNLFKDHAKFSNETFGYQRDHIGPLHHLKKEIDELLENPYDEHEYADCMLLLMDAYRRKGGTSKGFIQTCFEKLEINKNRNWGEADENGVIQHIEAPPKN